MEINRDRLKRNIEKVGGIGRTKEGGITRLSFSEEYKEASKILIKLMEDAGLEVTVDGLGDIIGRRKGKDDSLPAIMTGSHLDTVPNGGLFDGNLGVIGALECVYCLNENNIFTNHPIEIVAFNAEEGSEMGVVFASRVMAGVQDLFEEGLAEKLAKYGLDVESIKDVVKDVSNIAAFLELHIEQGGYLDGKRIPIGVVEGIVGITRYRVSVLGESNHAGTTPMALRKDAMTGAAKLIVEIESIARSIGNPFVATVGAIKAIPGAENVIPKKVEFTLELRNLDHDRIDRAMEEIKQFAEGIENVKFDFQLLCDQSPVMTDKRIVNTIQRVCADKDIQYINMVSGAGHDAKEIGRKVPAGMIFVPSKDGKSHCPEEWTDWEDIYKGVDVLLNTIVALDQTL